MADPRGSKFPFSSLEWEWYCSLYSADKVQLLFNLIHLLMRAIDDDLTNATGALNWRRELLDKASIQGLPLVSQN